MREKKTTKFSENIEIIIYSYLVGWQFQCGNFHSADARMKMFGVFGGKADGNPWINKFKYDSLQDMFSMLFFNTLQNELQKDPFIFEIHLSFAF